MKAFKKIAAMILSFATVAVMGLSLAACDGDEGLRFAVPMGTPALAITKLVADNKTINGKKINYAIVGAENIAAEMDKADLLIMPVNGGANRIVQGADYKLVSIAVEGSLFLIGKSDTEKTLTIDDLKGKKIACIGKAGVPGLVFRYVMSNNGIEIIESGNPAGSQIYVEYVSDATLAKTALADGKTDFAVVGEPAATAFKKAIGCRAEMDMQKEYKEVTGENSYPQAGLFVRSSIAEDGSFMAALFEALAASKEWVTANPSQVSEFVKANLYQSANFPAASIPRCALDATAIGDSKKSYVRTFLKAVMPKDSKGQIIDWDNADIFR